MQIKKFRARTIPLALKEVKETFGCDAVIISTGKVHEGYEVSAAMDFDRGGRSSGYGDDLKKSLTQIKGELDELRYIFSKVVKESPVREVALLGSVAYRVYEELLESGIHESLSRRLVRVAARATSDSPELIKKRCMRIITEKTGVHNPLKSKDGPRILALIGQPGSGKTTTIAKIAGGLKLKGNADVALVSIADKRQGSMERLRASARAFDMEHHKPVSAEQLERTLFNVRDKDVILIDTPGIGPGDAGAIKWVGSMLKSAFPIERGACSGPYGKRREPDGRMQGVWPSTARLPGLYQG